MVTLYQYPAAFGLPNASPFCMKVETWLRMVDIKFNIEFTPDPRSAPKKKLPYIEHEGNRIADSTLIIEYLKKALQIEIDKSLTPVEQALSLAISALLEERFYWPLLYSRWKDKSNWTTVAKTYFGHLPPLQRKLIPTLINKQMSAQLYQQGMGRHTEQEIYRFGVQDIDAMASLLGDKPYVLGEQPHSIDATVYAFMANTLEVRLDSPLREAAKQHANLNAYCKRMAERYYGSKDATI